ncbi:MAG TPA: fibronectin type III domain-containing protein, partial [Verrucomicrobiae bacterium]|nr:fibronectin type III domain-containing protein [Verrucomicrobiae bacterium]
STSGAQLSQNSAACNINDSTWSTAEIIQSSNEIQMQLNGQTVITYNSANLPVATGPLMGWGARSGGSTDYHLIRDVNLTESGDDVFTPSQTTVGAEGPASGTLNTSGNWMSPAINVGSGAVLGNGVSSSAALTANLADIGTGTSDSVEVGIQTGNSAAAAESASTQWLGTYTHANNGALTLTSANLTGAGVNITNNSNMYAVLVFSLSESSGVSPEVSNVVFSYTPGYYAPPSAPQNFTSTGDYSSGATLSWAAPANNNGSAIQHYSIYYSTDGGTTWNLITTTASTTYTINEGTLLYPGTGYEFKVTATNGNGEGPGATADLTTSAAPVTQISSCTQLQNINTENPFGTYELVQNIDCSGTNTWNGGAGFVPIGTDSSLGYFEGTFNGEGYTISNLYIHQPTGCDVGLFYRTLAATIADVTLSSPQISGECNVGSVAGATYGGSVSYASTTNGTVTGAASGSGIGGLIGDSDYNSNTQVPGTVETSSYTGTVAGGSSSQVGGLIGDVGTIMATNDYANGTVSGHNDVGGLIGLSATSETGVATDITDSYAAGSVTASEQYAGGLVGFDNDILVDNSFAAAAVTGGSGSYAGGLSGYDTASPAWSGNYYDQSTATQSACVGYSDSSNACLAVNTSGSPNSTYFFNNHTSAPLNQWNFNTIWSTQATSYPVLTADVTMHSTKPVIVLYGANPLYITEGGILVDPGAYVTDSDNTVQMHQIVSTNDVNTSVPGTYAITYNVSDNFGNAALPVTRTVIVPTPPSAQSSASATATPASAIASMPQDTSATTQATTDSSGQIYLDPFTDFTDGSGYEITGIVGQEYTFTATNDNGQTSTHTLTISSINDANSNYPTVTLTLHSTPQTFTMSSGQTVQKDVTGDSRPDIGITVDDITASNVALTVWDIQRTSVPKEQIALSSSDKQNDTWWWVVGAVVVMAFLVILYRRRERKDSAND